MSTSHSITALLSGVKRADTDAIYALFDRCYRRVVAISRRRLDGVPCCGFDQDDVANSAFREFLDRAAVRKFKKLENRQDVWQILAMLVGDKIGDRLQYQGRKKRGEGRPDVNLDNVVQIISKLDDPALEAEINDAKRVFLEKLPSDDHRGVIELLAEGQTHEEIAQALNLTLRTVDRRLEDIRLDMPKILGIDPPKKKSSGQRRSQQQASDEQKT